MGRVLGLTGGIATGKTTVIKIFRSLGYPVIDGDLIAREAVDIGTEGLTAIVQVFGRDILLENGQLNRQKLGELIFSNKKKRKLLDETLGPFIRKEILKQIDHLKNENQLTVVDIPLLYESQYERFFDKIAVVYLPEKEQLQRLMKRNHLTKEEALKRIHSQWSIEEKRKKADVIFDNQGTIEETRKQVVSWLDSFLKTDKES